METSIPQIVLIDGLPGSGKSTACGKVTEDLKMLGHQATSIYETQQDHPLHVIPTDETGAAWADIHLRIDADSFVSQSLERWKALLSDKQRPTYVIESFPFQSFIRVLFQMDTPADRIQDHWNHWLETITGNQASFIYFKEPNPRELFEMACAVRGIEWTSYMCQSCEQMPYAHSRGWLGKNAVVGVLSEYAALIDQLVDAIPIPTLVVESQPQDYSQRDTTIRRFLTPEMM